MPRDDDKNNDSRGRRDRPSGGKGRSGVPRGPEKKFAKRGFAGKTEGERAPYAGRREGARSFDKKPYSGSDKPYTGRREDRPPRGDRPNYNRDRDDARPASRFQDKKFGNRKPYAPRESGEKRPYTPRG